MIDTAILRNHQKIALCASGGKDSLAVLYLLREHLPRITIYHLDTGDLLPEMRESVAHIRSMAPNFVHIQGDVGSWIKAHGMPTDLLPYSAHPIGQMAGQGSVPLVTRYECCFANLMWPVWERVKADGNTLLIRGTKACDLKKLPAESGAHHDGVEIWLPINDWSHEDVFAYLQSVGAPIPRLYSHMTNSPECARCPAWWGEKRSAYLRQFHPELFSDYKKRLYIVTAEIMESIGNLNREMEDAA